MGVGGEEAVTPPTGSSEDGRGVAAEPDGGMGPLVGPGAEGVVGEPGEPASERIGLACPEVGHDFKGLVAALAAFGDGDSIGLVPLDGVASRPDTEDEPALGEVVYGGDGVGETDGVPEREQDDSRAYADTLGVGGELAEYYHGFEGLGAAVDVFGDPEGVEAR